MIDSNGMSIRLGLFYAGRLGNVWCSCFLRVFYSELYDIKFVSNTNNWHTVI